MKKLFKLICLTFLFTCQQLSAQRAVDVYFDTNSNVEEYGHVVVYDMVNCVNEEAVIFNEIEDIGQPYRVKFLDSTLTIAYCQIRDVPGIIVHYNLDNEDYEITRDFTDILGTQGAIFDFLFDHQKQRLYFVGTVNFYFDLISLEIREFSRLDVSAPISMQFDSIFAEAEPYKQGILVANSERLSIMDKDNMNDTETLFLFPEEYSYSVGTFVHHFSCDSILITNEGLYTFDDGSQVNGEWIIDVNRDTMIFYCDGIGRTDFDNYWNDVNYPIDCILSIDLDDDDSTAEDKDYRHISPCMHTDISISDIDVKVEHDTPIDSIVIFIDDPLDDQYLDAMVHSMISVNNNMTTEITLINNGSATNEDFQEVIDGILYMDDAPYRGGIIRVEFQAHRNYNVGKTATALIRIPDNDIFAGGDVDITSCAQEDWISLISTLDVGANLTGSFYQDGALIPDDFLINDDGSYLVNYIVSSDECADTAHIDIQILPNSIPPILGDTIICYDESYIVDLSTYGYQEVSWSDGAADEVRTISEEGTYMVTVNAPQSCLTEVSFVLSHTPAPTEDFQEYDICIGEFVAIDGDTLSEDNVLYDTIRSDHHCDSIITAYRVRYFPEIDRVTDASYAICRGDMIRISTPGLSDIVMENVPVANIELTDAGMYHYMGTDEYGCLYEDSFEIIVFDMPSVSIDSLLLSESELGMEVTPEYTGDIVDYSWIDVNDMLDCTDCPYPTIISDADTELTIIVTNAHGCADTASVQVRFEEPTIYLPNVVSQSSAILNNTLFYAKSAGELLYDLRVYDRWGGLLYEALGIRTNDPTDAWAPQSQNIQPGVFVYMITYTGDDDNQVVIAGDVTVVE